MLKKILVLFILLTLVIASLYYLLSIFNNGEILKITPSIKPIVIKTENIKLQVNSKFYPQNFIEIIYFDKYNLEINHNYDTDKVGNYKVLFNIYYNDEVIKDYLNLDIVDKEVITIEKIIYENNRDINNQIHQTQIDQSQNNNDEIINEEEIVEEEIIYEVEEPYFNIPNEISITLDSSLNDLARLISQNVETNVQVTVDYSSVNLSELGTYTIYYYTEIGTFENLIQVF